MFGGIDEVMAAFLERGSVAAAFEDALHFGRIENSMESVAADEDEGVGIEVNAIVIDGEGGAGADGHGEDVAHRMIAQTFLVEAEGTAYLVYPGLVVGDGAQSLIVEDVG